jgi:hypothetical protein
MQTQSQYIVTWLGLAVGTLAAVVTVSSALTGLGAGQDTIDAEGTGHNS